MKVIKLHQTAHNQRKSVIMKATPIAVKQSVTIDREELQGIMTRIMGNTTQIREMCLFLRGSITAAPSNLLGTKHRKNPEKCWTMLDFLHEEIYIEMGKLMRATGNRR